MREDLSSLGEFPLIERLVRRLPEGARVLLGPGDDAAILQAPSGIMLATADLLLEGVHFNLALSSTRDVGFKALAVNVSDIAAMGGEPRFALVSLGASSHMDVSALEDLYDGIGEAAREFGVAVAGGDTVSAPNLTVSVAVLGEAGPYGPVRRDGAQPGDVLCVTGDLGGAAAGLALLRAAAADPVARALLETFPGLAEAHRRGRARVAEGRAAAACGARAMIDVSDGLVADVGHICERSRVGAVLDETTLPLASGLEEVARWAGVAPRMFALAGGDDYELAIAMPRERLKEFAARIAPVSVTVVGEVVEGDRVRLASGADLPAAGWEHFRGNQ